MQTSTKIFQCVMRISERIIRSKSMLPINTPVCNRCSFHTTIQQANIEGLDQFFDDKENWGAQEVKVGRSWRKEELRLKSNQDLHKLWYVLLKERNMLFTMEQACKDNFKLFPNPERIDKVEESMQNLENVVRERNRAFMLLETGETGERPSGEVVDSFGRVMNRKFSEHEVPDYMNTRVYRRPTLMHPIETKFARLLREKQTGQKHAYVMRKKEYVAGLFKRFPDLDIEAVKAKFPDVDVEEVRQSRAARGNHSENAN